MAFLNLSNPIFHMDDPATGAPLVGGLVYTYTAGTSTALTTYSDSTLTTPNTNPVVLDSYGNAPIWFDQSMKIVVRSADTLTTYFTFDDISPVGGTSIVFGEFNSVINGDFESDTLNVPNDWTLSAYSGGTILVDTTAAVSGTQSLKFTGVGAGGGTATSTIFSVQANTDVLVEFTYKASNAASTNIVTMLWYKLDGTASSTASTVVHTDSATNPTSFTRYIYSIDVPSDATQAKIVLTGVSSGGGQLSSNTTFDNVKVITEPYLVPDTMGTVEANKVVTAGAGGAIAGVTLTSPVLNGTLSGTAFLDEDTMSSNSAIAAPSQQSVKAYVDNMFTFGSWTPTLLDSTLSASEGQTYTSRNGTYYAVGRIVFFQFQITMSSLGTLTGGDNAYIGGLPITSGTGINYAGGGMIDYALNVNVNSTNGQGMQLGISTGVTYATIYQMTTGTSSSTNVTLSEITATGTLYGRGYYFRD